MSGGVLAYYKRKGLDPTSIPANMGKKWSDDEVLQLLQNIRKKKSFEEIAVEHQRTVGGIKGRLRDIAVDYHNEGRPIEQIQKFTGLIAEEINDAIEHRRIGEANRERRKVEKEVQRAAEIKVERAKQYTFTEPQPTMKELMVILKDIQAKLTLLTSPVAPPGNP